MTEPLNGKLLNCSLQIVLGIALLTLTVTSVRAEQAEDVRMRTVENLARLFSQVPGHRISPTTYPWPRDN